MPRPFLKWPGGKYRCLNQLFKIVPRKGKRLIEPFVGGGAFFYNTEFESYIINDVNKDLYNLLIHVQKRPIKLINFTKQLFNHGNSEQQYYDLRELFNSLDYSFERAGIFLYLNRHSYNGLVRFNRQNMFNAPFGSYKKPYFPEIEIKDFSKKLKKVKITNYDFSDLMKVVEQGDVVYCDPPYIPISTSACFTAYSHNKFDLDMHVKLAEHSSLLRSNGAKVFVSNHDVPLARKIYKGSTKIHKINVSRTISCNLSGRSKVKEIVAEY